MHWFGKSFLAVLRHRLSYFIAPLVIEMRQSFVHLYALVVLVWGSMSCYGLGRILDMHEVRARVLALVKRLQGEVRLERICYNHRMLVVRCHGVTGLIRFCNDHLVLYCSLKPGVRVLKVKVTRFFLLVLVRSASRMARLVGIFYDLVFKLDFCGLIGLLNM